MSSHYASLIYEKKDHIAKVGLNRPKQLNALDPGILMELHDAWKDINEDGSIRVAVLYSALPGIFCSGMDLKTAIPVLTKAREPENEAEKWIITGWDGSGGVAQAMLKVDYAKKPIIAAINGYCLTGGFEMVMGADLRVATPAARLRFPEVGIGAIPGWEGATRLERIAGRGRALELALTAEAIDADTASRWGVLNRVWPADEFEDDEHDRRGDRERDVALPVEQGRDLGHG